MYGICRVQKVKAAAVKAMQYHNDRMPGEHSNQEIDPTRTHLNEERVRHGSYSSEVWSRIEKYRTDNGRKVRADAVVLVEGIITASPEFFEQHPDKEVEFFNLAHAFCEREFSKENIVHFTVHRDESGAPHAHFGFVPLKDGKLGWKEYFNGKSGLSKFQDRFFADVSSKFGLERGEKAEETLARHKTVTELKRETALELKETQHELEQVKQAHIQVAKNYIDTKQGLDTKLIEIEKTISIYQEKAESLRLEVSDMTQTKANLEREVEGLKQEKSDLRTEVLALIEEKTWLESALAQIQAAIDKVLDLLRPYLPEPLKQLARFIRDEQWQQVDKWHADMDKAADILSVDLPSRLDEEIAWATGRNMDDNGFEVHETSIKRDDWGR